MKEIEWGQEVSDEEFDDFLSGSDRPVVLLFWAHCCLPSLLQQGAMKMIPEDIREKVYYLEVDVDNSTVIPTKYEVKKIPLILILKSGKVVDEIVGMTSWQEIKEKIQAVL